MSLQIQVIQDAATLKALAPEWDELLAAAGCPSLCLTPEWLLTWWEVFGGGGRELFVLAVREGGRLVGLALLHWAPHRYHGVLPFRRLAFLGTGEAEAEEVCSEYLDMVAAPGREAAVAEAVWTALRDAAWDEMVLADVPEGSAMLAALRRWGAAAGVAEGVTRARATYVPLRGGWDGVLAGLGRSTRYRIRRALQEFERHGKLIEVTGGGDREAWLDRLAGLHQARWEARGQPGAFATERFRAFHRRFAEAAMPRGWVRLLFLEWDSEVVAGHYLFEYGDRVWFYQAGIRPFAIAGTGPGMLLHALAIRDAAARELAEYDFLKGTAAHKRQWSRQTRQVVTVRWGRGSLREGLLAGARWTAAASRPIRRLARVGPR